MTPAIETAIDYSRRANQHRPTDQAGMVAPIVDLARRGLTARDISAALGLTPESVLTILRDTATLEATTHV